MSSAGRAAAPESISRCRPVNGHGLQKAPPRLSARLERPTPRSKGPGAAVPAGVVPAAPPPAKLLQSAISLTDHIYGQSTICQDTVNRTHPRAQNPAAPQPDTPAAMDTISVDFVRVATPQGGWQTPVPIARIQWDGRAFVVRKQWETSGLFPNSRSTLHSRLLARGEVGPGPFDPLLPGSHAGSGGGRAGARREPQTVPSPCRMTSLGAAPPARRGRRGWLMGLICKRSGRHCPRTPAWRCRRATCARRGGRKSRVAALADPPRPPPPPPGPSTPPVEKALRT